MARILLAWELGGGYGHLTRLRSLAAPLARDGHELLFALRDLESARTHLREFGDGFLAAPSAQGNRSGEDLEPPLNMTEILTRVGFDGIDGLYARTAAWRKLFAVTEPDLILFDHSPTAMLAARGCAARTCITGTGFTVPPQTEPLPVLRTWLAPKPERIKASEAEMLRRINQVAAELDLPTLGQVSELFASDAQLLMTYPELDHHGAREASSYAGVPPAIKGEAVEWPEGHGPRVFAYLKPFKTLPAFLEALKRSGARSVVHMAKVPDVVREKFASDSLRFMDNPADLDRVGAEADLAVLNGGHASVATLLFTGTPLLILPLHLEHMLMGMSIEALGAGLSAPKLAPQGMAEKLKRLLADKTGDGSFAAAARKFGETHPVPTTRRFNDRVRKTLAPLLD